jgi:hypothetical protein
MLALAVISAVIIAIQYVMDIKRAVSFWDFLVYNIQVAFILVTIWVLYAHLP